MVNGYDSGSLVMRLTPEHRVPYYDYRGAWRVATAAEVEARPSRRTIPTLLTIGHDMADLR